jgi:hypothetical protein
MSFAGGQDGQPSLNSLADPQATGTILPWLLSNSPAFGATSGNQATPYSLHTIQPLGHPRVIAALRQATLDTANQIHANHQLASLGIQTDPQHSAALQAHLGALLSTLNQFSPIPTQIQAPRYAPGRDPTINWPDQPQDLIQSANGPQPKPQVGADLADLNPLLRSAKSQAPLPQTQAQTKTGVLQRTPGTLEYLMSRVDPQLGNDPNYSAAMRDRIKYELQANIQRSEQLNRLATEADEDGVKKDPFGIPSPTPVQPLYSAKDALEIARRVLANPKKEIRMNPGILPLQRRSLPEQNEMPTLGQMFEIGLTQAKHGVSDWLSERLGNGPIDPSIYVNDPGTRISNEVSDFAENFIPYLGQAKLAAQAEDLAEGSYRHGIDKTFVDMADSMDPTAANLSPDERILRIAGIGSLALGAVKGGLSLKGQFGDGLASGGGALETGPGVEPIDPQSGAPPGKAEYIEPQKRATQESGGPLSLSGTTAEVSGPRTPQKFIHIDDPKVAAELLRKIASGTVQHDGIRVWDSASEARAGKQRGTLIELDPNEIQGETTLDSTTPKAVKTLTALHQSTWRGLVQNSSLRDSFDFSDPTVTEHGLQAPKLGEGESAAQKGLAIWLKYRPDWSDDLIAQANEKIRRLNDSDLWVNKQISRLLSTQMLRKMLGFEGPENYDIDHTHDLQLGGADAPDNLAYLHRSVNRSIGAQVSQYGRGLDHGTKISRVIASP